MSRSRLAFLSTVPLAAASLIGVACSSDDSNSADASATTGGTTTGAGGATSSTSTTGGTPGVCNFTVTPSMSPNIPTVGIVEWTSDLAGLSSASIEFGLDTTYGMSAPVDLAEPNYRTLLLGMKASSTYNFRVVASNGSEECTSENFTVDTGAIPNGVLPNLTIDTPQPEALAPGFIMSGSYTAPPSPMPGYIIDADGDFVWWYELETDVATARMSYDGKWMWMMASNVPAEQGANVHRVSMDGSVDEDLSGPFEGASHSLCPLPDERVAFYAYGEDDCDNVKIYDPATGVATTLISAADAHGDGTPCHINAIEYSPGDQTLVFSDLDHSNVTKITLTGEVVWVLGGATSDFTGDGASWERQHGLHVIDPNRILIFNNGALGSPASKALEVSLDTNAMTASLDWEYGESAGISNLIMGDVQRLDNGNTLVAYSTQGVMHEVTSDGTLVRSISFGAPGAYGYVTHRPTLYGPPPK